MTQHFLVIGAGIAGLATAVALQRRSHQGPGTDRESRLIGQIVNARPAFLGAAAMRASAAR